MQTAHNTVSLLDLSDRWEMMQSAQARLEDAKVVARSAKRAEFEALRTFEEARQTYQLMLARQAKGGEK
jgi:hypothetical protein